MSTVPDPGTVLAEHAAAQPIPASCSRASVTAASAPSPAGDTAARAHAPGSLGVQRLAVLLTAWHQFRLADARVIYHALLAALPAARRDRLPEALRGDALGEVRFRLDDPRAGLTDAQEVFDVLAGLLGWVIEIDTDGIATLRTAR